MSGKGARYWSDMMERELKSYRDAYDIGTAGGGVNWWPEAVDIRSAEASSHTLHGQVALSLLSAYTSQSFTSYGSDVAWNLGPSSVYYYTVNDVMQCVIDALGNRPLFRDGDLYNIVRAISSMTRKDYLPYFEVRNKPSGLWSFFCCSVTPHVTHRKIPGTDSFSIEKKIGKDMIDIDLTFHTVEQLESFLDTGIILKPYMKSANQPGERKMREIPMSEKDRDSIEARIVHLRAKETMSDEMTPLLDNHSQRFSL